MKGTEPSFDEKGLDDLFAEQEPDEALVPQVAEASSPDSGERLEALLSVASVEPHQVPGEPPARPEGAVPYESQRDEAPASNQKTPRLALLVAIVAITLALVAGVVAVTLQGRIQSLNGQLTELQGRLAQLTAGDSAQALGGGQTVPATPSPELQHLVQQIEQLSSRIDTEGRQASAGHEAALAALSARLEQLETRQGEEAVSVTDTPGPAAVVDATASLEHAEPLVVPAAASTASRQESAGPAGAWVVNLLAVASAEKADEQIARLADLGITAYREQVNEGGRRWYRLRVGGFASADEARAFARNEALSAGYHGAWVAELK